MANVLAWISPKCTKSVEHYSTEQVEAEELSLYQCTFEEFLSSNDLAGRDAAVALLYILT